MSGIYIHIPFCKKACHYCDFHFSTNLRGIENTLKAMEREIDLRFLSAPIEQDTYYFGGGTPSLLPAKTISSLVDSAMKNAPLKKGGEFTLEATQRLLHLQHKLGCPWSSTSGTSDWTYT